MRAHTRWSWWQWPNLLGLDAPIVAIVWQALLGAAGHAAIALPGRLGLFLAVWAVYLTDRLMDARTPARIGATEPARHQFAREHGRLLLALLLAVLVCGVAVAVSVREAIRTPATIAGCGVAVYFILVHLSGRSRTVLPKELLVAVLFAAGVAIAPLARADPGSRAAVVVCAVLAALVFYLNLVAVEHHEWRAGSGAGRPHCSTEFAGRHLAAAAALLSLSCIGVGVFVAGTAGAACATSIAAALLAAVHAVSQRLGQEAVRVLWDVALVFPAIFLLKSVATHLR